MDRTVFAFVLIDVEKLQFHILEYLNHCFVYNSSYVWDRGGWTGGHVTRSHLQNCVHLRFDLRRGDIDLRTNHISN